MKKTAMLIYLGLPLFLFSQGPLEKLFYKIPAEYCMDKDLEGRKFAIEEMKEINTQGMMIDEKNGFLSYGAYQCSYDMCYWNARNEHTGEEWKLVAIDGVDICGGRLYFFREYNGLLEHYHDEIFDSFNAAYFFKETTKLKDIKPLLDVFYFRLPRKGYNITAYFGYTMMGEPDVSKNLLRGDKIDFKWNNGSFVMGEPYF